MKEVKMQEMTTATLDHEIRNPLNVITTSIQEISLDSNLSHSSKEVI